MHILKVGPFEGYEQSLLFKFEDLQKSQFLYKDAFEYISTKRATYKMNKLCFFTVFGDKCCKKMSLNELYLSINARFLLSNAAKPVFEWVILYYKNEVLSSFTAF